MNYRTTCPHCTTIFRLGADQLGAAQGWVQCSVCGAAFDARPSLLLEDGSPLPAAESQIPDAAPPPEAAAPAEHAAPAASVAAATEGAAAEETQVAGAEGGHAQDTDAPQGIIQRETPLDIPSIIIIDPEFSVPEDFGPLPQIYPEPSKYPPEQPATVRISVPPSAPVSAPARTSAHVEYRADPSDRSMRTSPPPRRSRSWAWATAGVLLLVTLLAQTAYFLRDSVVSQLPQTRPAFEQVCAALGCTLSLPKNLSELQIIGSDLQTEASGRLKLTLTLGNRASHVQAWPMLVLTLTDQGNQPLARRSFAPSEYLGDPQRIAAGIPALSEQALSLPLTVRDVAPMGFDLQLTY